MKRPGFTRVLALILTLSIALLPMAMPASPVTAAVSWAVYDGDLVLDSDYVSNAWVIKNGLAPSTFMLCTHRFQMVSPQALNPSKNGACT